MLADFVAKIQEDPRILAVFLFGSVAEQRADTFSDVDLWMVVEERSRNDILGARIALLRSLAPSSLVLTDGFLQTGDTRTAQIRMLYPGNLGPQQVDWLLHTSAEVSLPANGKPLHNPNNLAASAQRIVTFGQPPSTASVNLFWAEALTAVKYLGRGDSASAATSIERLQSHLDAERVTQRSPASTETQPGLSVAAGIRHVRSLSKQMHQIRGMPVEMEQEEALQDSALFFAWIDMVEQTSSPKGSGC